MSFFRRSLPPILFETVLYLVRFRRWPNFKNPKTFNEKIIWRKLYLKEDLYSAYSDKVNVRSIVRKKIGADYLIPLLYSGTDITPEELLALGDNIVVKMSHDSGSAVPITENTIEKSTAAVARMMESMNDDFGKSYYEWWYSNIPPQIIVEKHLNPESETGILDYKFYVFNHKDGSEPNIFIQIDRDRFAGHNRSIYDINRELIRFDSLATVGFVPNHGLPFPEMDNFDEMLTVAKKLAEDFDHVRIDLYNENGEVFFGEYTFSSSAGHNRHRPKPFNDMITHWLSY